MNRFKPVLRRLFGFQIAPSSPAAFTGVDGYVAYEEDPHLHLHRMIDAYLKLDATGYNAEESVLRTTDAGQAILSSDRATQVQFVLLAVRRLRMLRVASRAYYYSDSYGIHRKLEAIAAVLLRRNLPFSPADLGVLIDGVVKLPKYTISYATLATTIERVTAEMQDIEPLRPHLTALLNWAPRQYEPSFRRTLERLLHPDALAIANDTPLGEAIHALADQLTGDAADAFANLVEQAASYDRPSRPSATYLDETTLLVERIGVGRFNDAFEAWLGLVDICNVPDQVRHFDIDIRLNPFAPRAQAPAAKASALKSVLRGLLWAGARTASPSLLQATSHFAQRCFDAHAGTYNLKLGNGCLHALALAEHPTGLMELAALRQRISHKQARKLLTDLLETTAHAQGLSMGDIEDRAVPTFGMREGVLHRTVGDYTAELSIAANGKSSTTLHWIQPDGKRQKSVPAAVKRDTPEAIKEMRRTAKEVRRMLSAQRTRIDGFYLEDRIWTMAAWRERFLHHGLLSPWTCRLIWLLGDGHEQCAAFWSDGRFVDAEGTPLDSVAPDTTVRLWHPLHSSVEEVLAWRHFIEVSEIRQPFKQAHREVYVLTDAERTTDTYSNRFAAHVLKQHQMAALARGRDWSYRLQGAFDGGYGPDPLTRPLAPWNLTAEYWVEALSDDTTMNHTGMWQYVTTDQVRFVRDNTPLPLEDIPGVVLSEVMRDVDLFVGVASIGNDPAWADRGNQPGLTVYWRTYAFGDLSASASTRRDVLSTLLPCLAIADRCTLTDRFLVVRGDVRTYKIHLGSTNILMEPNDQYLCIVPDRTAKAASNRVYIPFEGDTGLSLILSKAFLLARDTEIKDPTILSQIRRRR